MVGIVMVAIQAASMPRPKIQVVAMPMIAILLGVMLMNAMPMNAI
jgi:hypothetical protein